MNSAELTNFVQVILVAVVTLTTLPPLARALIKRYVTPRPVVQSLPDAAEVERMERLERAVEAISMEVERISEGQRFVTKLLSSESTEKVPALQVGAGDGRSGTSGGA